jgi:cell wall-associated NlpC family hydrolase
VKPRASLLRLAMLGWLAGALAAGMLNAGELAQTSAVHQVRAGDTVARICWQYKVRTEFILAANPGLTEPLTVGQRLVIPLGPGPGLAADPPAATPPPMILVARAVSPPPPPPPAAEPPDAETAPPPVAAGPPEIHRADFASAARDLAARKLRYEERWTPPGESEAWVMDCSNTSRYLYRAVAGVDIGRTASDQYYFLRQQHRAWDVPTGWDHLPRLDYLRRHLAPGDLLFWENTYKPVRSPDITHVMVYLGQDADGRWQMAGAQESAGVSIYRFDPQAPKGGYSSWFGLVRHQGRFVAYGRPLASGL